MSSEAKIKLTVDTSEAQQQVKLVDKQLNELGRDGSKIDLGMDSADFKSFVELQKKFVSSFNSYASTIEGDTKKILQKLEDMNSSTAEALKRDAEDEYEKKLRELENKKRMMEATLQSRGNSGSGGGNSGSGGNDSGGSGTGGNSGLGKVGDLLSQFGKKAGALTVGLAALRTVAGYVSNGAKEAATTESQSYMLYNKTGMFGSDFNAGRDYAIGIGSPYGMSARDTMNTQSIYMGKAGFSDQESLTEDTTSIIRFSKAYGLGSEETASVAGKLVQTGTLKAGEQKKFTDMLAQSIIDAEMTGREGEQLQVLESINDNLSDKLVNVSSDQLSSAMGFYDMLANGTAGWKGTRGANVTETINNAITGGGNKMDLLLGWGTQYTGTEGRWQLELAKERGLSDPENLKNIFSNFRKFTGYDVDSDMGKLMLKEQFGLSASEVEELLKHKDEIESGSYAQELQDTSEGQAKINENISNYEESKVSTQEQYEVEKDNAAQSAGDVLNNVTKPFKDLYNMLPEPLQAGVSAAGEVLKNPVVQGAIGWKAAKGVGKLYRNWKNPDVPEGFASYVDDIVDTYNAGGNVDDILKGLSKNGKVTDEMYEWADEVVDAYNTGADNIDDAIKEGYKQFGRHSKGWMDDAAKGASEALNNADEAAEAGGNIFSKAKEFFTNKINSINDAITNGADDVLENGANASNTVDDVLKGADDTVESVTRAAGQADDVLKGADDAVRSAAQASDAVSDALKGADDVVRGAAGGADDVLKGASGASKVLGKAAVGIGIALDAGFHGYDAYKAHESGDEREMASQIGGGVGSIGGGLAGGAGGAAGGSALGGIIGAFFGGIGAVPGAAIGGLIGGIGGSIGGSAAGEKIGEGVGELIYDANGGDDYQLSSEAKNKIKQYYKEVYDLWSVTNWAGIHDNDSAQEYTLKNVVPYLESLGVSKSITKKYNNDVGYPDFLEDVEAGVFGEIPGTYEISGKSQVPKNLSGNSVNMNGIPAESNAIGKAYVPYDGFLSLLHKGETVLSKDQAKEWRERQSNPLSGIDMMDNGVIDNINSGASAKLTIEVTGSIDGMTPENQNNIVQAVISKLKFNNNSVYDMLTNGYVRVAH
jgi:hypothetical protein